MTGCRVRRLSLLIAGVIACLFAVGAFECLRLSKQRRIERAIESRGVIVEYNRSSAPAELSPGQPREHLWRQLLVACFGEERFGLVRGVSLGRDGLEKDCDTLSLIADLSTVERVSIADVTVTDVLMSKLVVCRPRCVGFLRCAIKPEAYVHMGDLKMLEYLYVASPKKHALENCRFLSGLERLREIGIEGSLVDVTALASGLGNRSLVYLSLKDSDLVGHLGAFEGLDGVRGLSLEGTNIDDRSLEHVAEMESLEALRLDRTGVSDAGLRCLYRAARLMAISLLDMPGVTDAGVNGLKAAKPKARVVFGGIHTGD